jgi:sulfite reductase (NADPH) flavoprotein alpha-component
MNSPMRPPLAAIVPESAPFTAEQRVWLDGFFAGLLDGDATALSQQEAQALLPGAQIGAAAEEDDGAPWHDQTMPLTERMKLAEGRPLPRRMMAAMGQQDCGQCGYDCKDYADALFTKKEERLNLCVPGGKETARMLKALHTEIGSAPAPAAAKVADAAIAPAEKKTPVGTSRDNPVEATFVSRVLLNKPGSAKETWHIEFDLTECGLDYQVGDAFGLYPHNDPALADAVLRALDAPPDFPIGGRTLREVLIDGVSLAPAPDMLFQLFSYITGGERRKKAQALSAGEDPDGDAATLDVLAAIEKFSGVRPDPEAFIEALDPLQPRLYSISSSPKVHKGPRGAHRRCGPLRHRQTETAGRRFDLPRRARRAGREAPRLLCRRPTPSACRPIPTYRSSWSGPAPAWRHSAHSCMSGWRPRRRAATGCSSATRSAISISSTRTSSPA